MRIHTPVRILFANKGKKHIKHFVLALLCCSLAGITHAQNVGINTTGTPPNSAAILDLSTGNTAGNMGFLAPKVSLASISTWGLTGTATVGMLVYNTSTTTTGGNGAGYYYWGTNAQWNYFVTPNAGWLLTGNSGNPPESSPNWNTRFIGTNDGAPLVFEVEGSNGGWMDADGEVYFGPLAGASDAPNSNDGNTGIGYWALTANIPGAVDNTAVGCYAAQSISTGNDNTGIGYFSLISNSTGNQITTLGSESDVTTDGLTDAAAIGYDAKVSTSYTMQFGDGNITDNYFTGNVHASCGVLICSDIRYKKEICGIPNVLNSILKLQPVNYYLKTTNELAAEGIVSSAFKGSNDKEKQIGFIAQQVEPLFPEVVHTDKEGYKSVDYSKFAPVLVKAIQEQQHTIDSLKEANAELKGTVSDLKSLVSGIKESQAKSQADIAELKKLIYLSSQTAEAKK